MGQWFSGQDVRARRRAARNRRRRPSTFETLERRCLLTSVQWDWLYANEQDQESVEADLPRLTERQTFSLESRPDAAHTIYLDFDGHRTIDTPWNRSRSRDVIEVQPWSMDRQIHRWSEDELAAIHQIWAAVAEDYSPFDVNVTTRDPGVEALRRTSARDDQWGVRVVVGPDPGLSDGALGVAYLNTFTWHEDAPVFVFAETVPGIALTTSHEVGHTLGLEHDGVQDQHYYGGHGSWGPIMGNPLSRTLTQWSNGGYVGATNREDDLSVITSGNGFGFVADDVGDSARRATMLDTRNGELDVTYAAITQPDDVDVFRFEAAAGLLQINADVLELGANLNVQLELRNAAGKLIARSNPDDSLGAAVRANLIGGQYTVSVTGVGDHDYSDYGSLGQYRLSGTVPQAEAAAPTEAPDETAASPTARRYRIRSTRQVQIDANSISTARTGIRVPPLGGTIQDLNVQLDIDHSWVGDLQLTLIAPDGRRIPLSMRRGGSGDEYRDTVFDDQATTSIASARAPFVGRFRPETPLNTLSGMDPTGVWYLEVRDRARLDGGRVHGWSLQMTLTSGPSASLVASNLQPTSQRGGTARTPASRQLAEAPVRLTSPRTGNAAEESSSTRRLEVNATGTQDLLDEIYRRLGVFG